MARFETPFFLFLFFCLFFCYSAYKQNSLPDVLGGSFVVVVTISVTVGWAEVNVPMK